MLFRNVSGETDLQFLWKAERAFYAAKAVHPAAYVISTVMWRRIRDQKHIWLEEIEGVPVVCSSDVPDNAVLILWRESVLRALAGAEQVRV